MWVALLISNFDKVPDSIKEEFQGKARIIEDLYNRFLFLNKVKIHGIRKVAITLINRPEAMEVINGPIKGFSPVLNISVPYDFYQFSKLDDSSQKESILELIHTSLIKAGEKFNWSLKQFDSIPFEIRRVRFKNCFIVGKLKPSKNNLYKAGVEVDFQSNFALISIVFYSKDQELIKKVELIKVHPNRLFVAPLIGSSKWLNNEEFELRNKLGEIHFTAAINKEAAQIFFSSKSKTTDQLIDELLITSIATGKDQIIKLLKDQIDRSLN